MNAAKLKSSARVSRGCCQEGHPIRKTNSPLKLLVKLLQGQSANLVPLHSTLGVLASEG